MDFVHLHVHSHYSLLNGLTKIKPLVKVAKERGFKAIALTDYGAMYGAIEFYQACQTEGIKPIIGFEAFVVDNLSESLKEQNKPIYRLVLLAKNFIGYQNLMRLSSFGQLYGLVDNKPCVDNEIIKKYANGVIALSGPIEGKIPQLLKNEKIQDAEFTIKEYQEIFGKENFYLEIQDHPAIENQMNVNTKMIQVSKNLGAPLVVTRDVHYLNPDDIEAQDIMRCISEGWKVGQMNREDYRQVDRSLNKSDDIFSRFRHIPEALENTVKIAEKINLEIPLDVWHFAPVELPDGKTADDVLEEKAKECLGKFFNPITDEVQKRFEYEFEIIKTKGYAPYFLCVADYVKYAKDNGIVQTTRGSAAGSLISYVIGITTVDPIKFKLPFERFLNPYRPSPPDIDTDFADDRRNEMINYVTKKYGEDKVAQIITFGTMAARASVRDVGRALGYSYNFCDQVAKLIPMGSQGFHMTIDRALKEEPDLRKLYETNVEVKKLLDLAKKVEGCARHTSIHAAGVVISPTPLTDYTPIQKETGGDKLITQYEMKSVETAGVLKMDFLGIRNLSILGKAVEIVEKTIGEKVDIYTLPLDDKITFEMLARGETMGTFQLGGSGMTHWLKELKPTTVDDIMAMVALYRPGPMESIPEYVRRKNNPEFIEYLDPRMKKYLEASFGLLVYQDDVLLTAIELAGYDWMEADKFRKAIGKKIPEEMEKQKIKFFQGCRDHGKISEEKIKRLWELIEPFAAYGFNKAHAASYGTVSYQTSFMKAHYPTQYMTAVLQAEAGDADKVSAIVHECHRMNIQVLPPDVNESFRNFAMVSKQGEEGRIRFGLTAIKNVGEHICEVIYRERKERGQYKSLEDLLERVTDKDLNKKSLESLIQAGALDCFGFDRFVLYSNIENILGFARHLKEKVGNNQNSLFSGTGIELNNKVVLKESREATIEEKMAWEKNLLGIYVSAHPFAYFENILKDKIISLNKIEECERGKWIVVGGVIDSLKKKITKKGSIMMFATIQDQTANMEMLVFPKAYEVTKDVWKEGNVVCVVGKIPKESGENKIFVEKAYVLSKENVYNVVNFLSFNGSNSVEEKFSENYLIINLTQEELKNVAGHFKFLFEKYPGEWQVYVRVGNNLIKAQSKIDWNDEIKKEIEDIVVEGRIEIKQ